MGGSGVMRAVKLAKYLPQFGWQPTVLTVTGGDAFVYDESLLQELPDVVTIERAPSIEVLRRTQAKHTLDRLRSSQDAGISTNWAKRNLIKLLKSAYFSFFVPDDKIGWLVPAVKKGMKAHQERSFEAIFATSPPQTNLLVADQLKRRLSIPMILDYRDEWTTNPHRMIPNAITMWVNRSLEGRLLSRADMVTVVSQSMIENLAEAGIIEEGKARYQVLPNGFDPADFETESLDSHASSKFHVVHTGSFYGDYRVPDPFLSALKAWLQKSPRARKDVQVSFYGSVYPRHQHPIDALELCDVVQVVGIVPSHQAIGAQCGADILLLIIGKGEGKAILTGKVFEYLGARKPILAVVPPDGEAAKLIQQTNAGIVVDPDDTGAIVHALEDLYAKWERGGIPYVPDVDEVNRYSRVEQARQLSNLFEQITQ
jgi:glycosyltransferase involved in cell wall biosynthesis